MRIVRPSGLRASQTPDEKTRWKMFWEFLEEYRWEPQDIQTALLLDEPPSAGDETVGRPAGGFGGASRGKT